MKKHIMILVLLTLFCHVSLSACSKGEKDTETKDTEPKAPTLNELMEGISVKDIQSAQVGDVVCIGRYEQDGRYPGKEELYWDVIDEEDGKLFLVSHFVIEHKAFTIAENRNPGWGKSYVRTWLNGDFYKESFSEEEKQMILLSEVDNSYPSKFFDDIGEEYYEVERDSTQDYVFLLGWKEIMEYYNVSIYKHDEETEIRDEYFSDELIALPTPYYAEKEYEQMLEACEKFGVDPSEITYPDNRATWLLRSDYTFEEFNMLVRVDGYIGPTPPSGEKGVRPAMWIKLSNEDQ